MLQSHKLRSRVLRGLEAAFTPRTVCCLATGGSLTLAAMSWLATYGLGLSIALATILAGCSGLTLAFWAGGQRWSSQIPGWSRWLAITSWLGLMPVWISVGNVSPSWLSTNELQSITFQILAVLPAAICLIGLPAFLVTFALSGNSTSQSYRGVWSLLLGSLITMATWESLIPGAYLLWAYVIVLLSASGWNLAVSGSSTTTFSTPNQPAKSKRTDQTLWLILFPALMVGLWAVMSMIIRPWTLITTTILGGQFLLLVIAALLSYGLSGTQHRLSFRLRQLSPTVWLLLPILASISLVLQEERVTQWMMTISAELPNPFQQQSIRLMILGSYPFLMGISTGIWFRKIETRSVSARSRKIGAIWLAAFCFAATRIALHSGVSAASILLGFGVIAVVVASFQTFLLLAKSTGVQRRQQVLTTVILGTCTLLGSIQLPSQTGQLPSKLLFHASAWTQFRSGVPWDSLPYIDDARQIESVSSDDGLYTAYNYRGLETSIRRNGIPQGYVSLDYRVMPQFPTDVLMAVLPSVIHGQASNIAICRWGCGVTVSSSLDFPIESIDCFDAEPELVDLTYGRQTENPWAGLNPLSDSRVTLYDVSPELALRSTGREYDVIVSSPMRSATVESVSEMTAEFYRCAANRLATDGLFCQRFQHYDHGPSAWADVLSTLETVFPHVVAIEMLPGETLFVAGASETLVNNQDLVTRLQKPQIRRVLARFGWDWGHLLNLPTVTADKTGDLLASVSTEIQSIQTPMMFQKHRSDAMRWANKWEEKTEALSPFKSRLVSMAGEEGQTAEVKRRMEEVGVQQKEMAELVDLPWAYRAKLKEFLTIKPRSKVRQVKGEKPRQEMHPVDKRRVDYLQTLSDAHQTKPVSAEAISKLNNFSAPYDPLVSYFLHHEAAELYARNPELDPSAEFHHRLKTIYFGDVRDKSVRNVIGALNLLLEHEELVNDDQTRFDQMHGLVQFLLNRWQLRRGYSPRNTDEGLVDVRESLKVAQKALQELDRLVASTAYGEEEWQFRREYLEVHLVNPLRAYRGHLIPHHQQKSLNSAATDQE